MMFGVGCSCAMIITRTRSDLSYHSIKQGGRRSVGNNLAVTLQFRKVNDRPAHKSLYDPNYKAIACV